MSPRKDGAMLESARQAAAQLRPAAEKARPYAQSAGVVARRQLLRTRAWAAPQIERSGQVLQDTVAPKAAALLSEAARRVDPAQPRQRRFGAGIGVVLATMAAAAGAAAAWMRGRKQPVFTPGTTTPATPTTAPNGQASTIGADSKS